MLIDSDLEDLLVDYRKVSNALHACWTHAARTPGYDKSHWKTISNAIDRKYADAAALLGYRGPLVP